MMATTPEPRNGVRPARVALLLAIVALLAATLALTAIVIAPGWSWSMMRGTGMIGGPISAANAGPGEAGFVAGTPAAPRVVRLWAGPGYSFSPPSITVDRGETVTFVVTTMGPLVHEFMVGPAEAVAADRAGTPEVADIGMMQVGSLTFTFDGTGPYAYACHAPGHFEAGMRGTITVVG